MTSEGSVKGSVKTGRETAPSILTKAFWVKTVATVLTSPAKRDLAVKGKTAQDTQTMERMQL